MPGERSGERNTAEIGWLGQYFRGHQYWFYSRGTALNYFLRRRIRPAGIGLLIVIIVATGAAAGSAEPPVFQTFSLACGLILISMIYALFRRAKVEAVRELPAHATAGQGFTYHVSLRNRRGKELKRIELIEPPADPRPSGGLFIPSREPPPVKEVAGTPPVFCRVNDLSAEPPLAIVPKS